MNRSVFLDSFLSFLYDSCFIYRHFSPFVFNYSIFGYMRY